MKIRTSSAGDRTDQAVGRGEWANLPPETISVRISAAVKLTGISRSVIYELINDGAIETRKIGRSTFILYRSLKRLIEG